jgi:hypothetical protein
VLAGEPNLLLAETCLPGNLALNGCREQVEICRKVIGGHDQRDDSESVYWVLHRDDYATLSAGRMCFGIICYFEDRSAFCAFTFSTNYSATPVTRRRREDRLSAFCLVRLCRKHLRYVRR